MKAWLCAALLGIGLSTHAAETRFDALHFFQPEQLLQQKGVTIESLGRYTRTVQSKIYRALKNEKLPQSSGWLVIAVRSDGEVSTWLDMQPVMHEFYDNLIYDTVKKIAPLDIKTGIFVFAIKLNIDTLKFTRKLEPNPPGWNEARKKIANPNNIEELTLYLWPE